MSVKKLIIGVICCAVLVPQAGLADDKPAETAKNRQIMLDYAKCVVKQRHDRVAEAILSNVDNDMIQRQYRDLIRPDCLVKAAGGDAAMKFGGDLYRYALADALVNADFAKAPNQDFSNRLPLSHLPLPDRAAFDLQLAEVKDKRQRDAMEKGFGKAAGTAWLSNYGECIVRQQPEKARLWLLTSPGVPEEMSRINDIASAFAPCLPASAGKVRFSRTTMRGAVAINYYRLSMATVQATTGKVK